MKNVLPAVFIAFMTLAFTPAQASFMSAGKSIANNFAASGSAITEVGYRGRSFRSRGFYKNRGFRFGRQHRSNRYAYGNSRKSQIANRIFTRQAQDGP